MKATEIYQAVRRQVAPVTLLAGIALGLGLMAVLGRQAARENQHPKWLRFHRFISPETNYYATINEMLSVVRATAKPDQILDELCPRCNANLVIKQGRYGEFTACTKYPECKYVKHKTTGVVCPKDADKVGEVVERRSKRGKVFFGCSNYPDCDFVLWNRPIAEACPTCKAPFLTEKITKKHGRQLICNTEDCDYSRAEELQEATA